MVITMKISPHLRIVHARSPKLAQCFRTFRLGFLFKLAHKIDIFSHYSLPNTYSTFLYALLLDSGTSFLILSSFLTNSTTLLTSLNSDFRLCL